MIKGLEEYTDKELLDFIDERRVKEALPNAKRQLMILDKITRDIERLSELKFRMGIFVDHKQFDRREESFVDWFNSYKRELKREIEKLEGRL